MSYKQATADSGGLATTLQTERYLVSCPRIKSYNIHFSGAAADVRCPVNERLLSICRHPPATIHRISRIERIISEYIFYPTLSVHLSISLGRPERGGLLIVACRSQYICNVCFKRRRSDWGKKVAVALYL